VLRASIFVPPLYFIGCCISPFCCWFLSVFPLSAILEFVGAAIGRRPPIIGCGSGFKALRRSEEEELLECLLAHATVVEKY
jgi:hypothetical protein